MNSQPIEASLATIANGGAMELFERELTRLLANIKDPNTDPKKKRRINLKFEFSPYPDRSGCNIDISVEAKLQAVNGVAGSIFIGRISGAYQAFTRDIRQGDLFNSGENNSNDEVQETSAPTRPV